MPPASMSLWSRVSQCQQPLPCGFLGTFQYLGSSSNEQKDVDKSESVLGSSEEHQRYSVACFLLSEVAWHEKLFIKNNSLRSKSRNFMLWNVLSQF